MNVCLDKGAFAPTRAHDTDAGLDLRAKEDKTLFGFSCASFDTGVHIQLPKGTCGILISKSGLYTKHNITSTGLIDEGYTGSIVVRLVNYSHKAYEIHKGDKISQLVIVPCLYEDVELVKELPVSQRGQNGFGSTGR